MKIKSYNGLPETIVLSVVGFCASWLFGLIPHVGIVFASLVQILMGAMLGMIWMHFLAKLFIALFTFGGFCLGVAGSHSEKFLVFTTIVALVFCLAYLCSCSLIKNLTGRGQ